MLAVLKHPGQNPDVGQNGCTASNEAKAFTFQDVHSIEAPWIHVGQLKASWAMLKHPGQLKAPKAPFGPPQSALSTSKRLLVQLKAPFGCLAVPWFLVHHSVNCLCSGLLWV